MITVKVKTSWQSKVAIRDRYIEEAERNKEGITILHNDSRMIIPYDELQGRIVARSDQPVIDKFSGQSHYLVYLKWQPTEAQVALF